MFRMVIPVTILVMACGCNRQPSTTYAATPRPQAQPAPQPAPGPPVVAPAPVGHSSPVVSAEPADPTGIGRKPSAFAPHTRPAVHRMAPNEKRDQSLVIPPGTRIQVRLAQTLDTRWMKPGDRFAASLDNPIVAGNRVVVPRGTPFEGVIEESKSSGRFRGRAVMMMRLRSFRMDGVTYLVSTAPDTAVSGNHRNRNLIFMGGGPAAGASIGAIAAGGPGALIGAGAGAIAGTTTALFTGKKNVKLPVESRLVFSLRSGVPLRRS